MNVRFLMIVLWFSISVCFANAGQKIVDVKGELETKLDKARILAKTNPEKGSFVIDSCYQQSLKIENETLIIKSLLALCEVNYIRERYSLAFDYSGEALFKAEVLKDTLLMAKAYGKFGVLYANFHQKKESELYLKKSITLSKYLAEKKRIPIYELKSRYFDLVQAYRGFEMYNEQKVYLDSCYALSKQVNNEPIYLDVEKGLLLLNTGNHVDAIHLFNKIVDEFESIDNSYDLLDEKGYLSVVYAYLGEAYQKNHQNKIAEQCFVKSIKLLNLHKRYVGHKASVLEKYSSLLLELGKYKEAYAALVESNLINKKDYKAKGISSTDFFTIRNKYHEELELKERELVKRKEKEFLNKILFFAVLFVAIVIWLIVYIKNQKKKEELLKEQSLRKEKEALELLELKNKELTRSALKIIEKGELIKSIAKHLEELPKNVETSLLIKEINKNKINLWDDFNARFMAVNKGFYERLLKRVPNLSQADLKICALIKLNFTGKEMAHLLGISLDSVHKSRYRLRKKIDLERDVNLTNFISSI